MQTTTTKPSRIQQLRLTTVVSPVQKQRAEKLAKDLTGGDVGELVRALLLEKHKAHVTARKLEREKAAKAKAKAKAKKVSTKTKAASKSTSRTKSPSKKGLISSSHVAPTKPGRKRTAGNATSNGTKSSSAKRVVATKGSRKRPGTTTKKR